MKGKIQPVQDLISQIAKTALLGCQLPPAIESSLACSSAAVTLSRQSLATQLMAVWSGVCAAVLVACAM